MDYNRIIAIGGLTFCTTMLSTGLTNPEASLLNAALMAGVALFTEMKIETEGTTKHVQKVLKAGLVL